LNSWGISLSLSLFLNTKKKFAFQNKTKKYKSKFFNLVTQTYEYRPAAYRFDSLKKKAYYTSDLKEEKCENMSLYFGYLRHLFPVICCL